MRGAHPEVALQRQFARHCRLVAGQTALIALSGGSDSVALAALAAAYAGRIGATLVFAHVNHRLRASSGLDEAVAASVSSQLGRPLRIAALPPGGIDEARLRKERYAALRNIAVDVGAHTILTGHTADDQTETVLLALFRGTGRVGLMGMPVLRELCPGLTLIRPLLRIDRAALRRHCERSHLPYVLDPSNGDLHYRRNQLRVALGGLRPQFPGLDRAVARCADLLRLEKEEPATTAQAQALREWLKDHGVVDSLSAERVGALLQLVELGQGRQVRLILERGELTRERGSSRRKAYDGEDDDPTTAD